MADFAEIYVKQRRLFVLRFLVELGGDANEGVIYSAVQRGGFGQTSRDGLRSDLDHLSKMGCTHEEWLGDLRVARVTERGEDIAYGREACAGVEHTVWHRGA